MDIYENFTPDKRVELFKKALSKENKWTWEDVLHQLVNQQAILRENEHGSIISKVVATPHDRWMELWLVIGKMPEVLSLMPILIEDAKINNCSHIEAYGRMGWKKHFKVLKDYGWKPNIMIYRNELGDK